MKILKKLLCAVAVLSMLLCLFPAAYADNAADEKFRDKTWDELIEEFIGNKDLLDRQIALGYYNLVTGEEHYLHGDQYMVAASTYKVPLNMVFAEKISRGEMSLDTVIGYKKYSELLHTTIVDSSNNDAETLWLELGDYMQFRRMIAPYMGEDPATVSSKFYENNFNTPRQSVTCLKLLYENPDRFPNIIETMKEAEPEQYFKYSERRYEIAHKYGYNTEEWHTYLNDTGIVYTEDPFIIVFFSDNFPMAYERISEYCTLMCDYTQYHTALRHEQETAAAIEEGAKAEAEIAAVMEPQPVETPVAVSPSPDVIIQTEKEESSMSFSTILLYFFAIVLTAAAIAFVVAKRKKVSVFWGFIASVIMGIALLVCIIGSSVGTLITATEGNPVDSVTGFFDAVTLGNYEQAYTYLEGYTTLGLENDPSGEAGMLLHQALKDSYSYAINGSAEIDGITASQNVDFTYLDLSYVDEHVQAIIQDKLSEIVAKHNRNEVYDENNNYRPAITEEAYLNALKAVLDDAESCHRTVTLKIQLDYINETWLINPEQTLFRALFGGIS